MCKSLSLQSKDERFIRTELNRQLQDYFLSRTSISKMLFLKISWFPITIKSWLVYGPRFNALSKVLAEKVSAGKYMIQIH